MITVNASPSPAKRRLTITCSSCGQEWSDGHKCPVPPEIDWSRYTTSALEQLAAHLALVIKGRKDSSREG